jgi:hypothetical protein
MFDLYSFIGMLSTFVKGGVEMLIEPGRSALYPPRLMQMVSRVIFAGVLTLSVLVTAMPMPAAMAAPTKSSCCARMKMGQPANDCGKQAPKSQGNRDCCVGCANCLVLYLPNHHQLNFSPTLAWILALTSVRENSRTERPPVAPPRSAVG